MFLSSKDSDQKNYFIETNHLFSSEDLQYNPSNSIIEIPKGKYRSDVSKWNICRRKDPILIDTELGKNGMVDIAGYSVNFSHSCTLENYYPMLTQKGSSPSYLMISNPFVNSDMQEYTNQLVDELVATNNILQMQKERRQQKNHTYSDQESSALNKSGNDVRPRKSCVEMLREIRERENIEPQYDNHEQTQSIAQEKENKQTKSVARERKNIGENTDNPYDRMNYVIQEMFANIDDMLIPKEKRKKNMQSQRLRYCQEI